MTNTGGGPSNNNSADKSIDRTKTTPGQIKAMIGFFENTNSTSFGLTADDIKRGLNTIEIKCEHLFIGFSRLAALHGVRPNITPFCVAFHGASGGTEYTYVNRVKPSLAAIEAQTFAVFGGKQEVIEEVSQLLVGSDAAESSTRSSAPLSSGAPLAAAVPLASGAPLAARSLSTEPVSTERSSSFRFSSVGPLSNEPLSFSRPAFGEASSGQPSSVEAPSTNVASSPLLVPSNTQPSNRTLLFESSLENGLFDSFSFDDAGDFDDAESYYAVDHDNDVNSGSAARAGPVAVVGGRARGRGDVSRAGTFQPEMPTADRIRVDPDHAMRNKRIKRDFSSEYRDEYREAQLRRDEVLRENSQREFDLGMSQLLVTCLTTNALNTASFTEITRHLADFRRSLRDPVNDDDVYDDTEYLYNLENNEDEHDDGNPSTDVD
ncbi:hypothetical protein INT47_000434 [Mucor saturninus]|uniref:Uncharacterized protein n=1 Tax=Mucor saturninus TaxID=64648 RepID=A0A8H7QDT0_9FUNG|nr:hypothetical protein INT47_000434 [Mucor saturninus]